MNNFEKIKAMTLEQTAEFIKATCGNFLNLRTQGNINNEDYIKQWLQQESEG